LKRPGIVAAFTGEALADEWAVHIPCGWPVTEDIKTPGHWPLARKEVNHEGDGVVLVATDRYKARDTPGLVEVY
jgi:aerobic carbon-monoxide dehydrogenase large subunit